MYSKWFHIFFFNSLDWRVNINCWTQSRKAQKSVQQKKLMRLLLWAKMIRDEWKEFENFRLFMDASIANADPKSRWHCTKCAWMKQQLKCVDAFHRCWHGVLNYSRWHGRLSKMLASGIQLVLLASPWGRYDILFEYDIIHESHASNWWICVFTFCFLFSFFSPLNQTTININTFRWRRHANKANAIAKRHKLWIWQGIESVSLSRSM